MKKFDNLGACLASVTPFVEGPMAAKYAVTPETFAKVLFLRPPLKDMFAMLEIRDYGMVYLHQWERSGSVVECLTRDRRAVGSSLTGVTALCP